MAEIALRPWADGDEPLLHALLGDPAMMEHLGGPESAEKIARRHLRYLPGNPEDNRAFVILVGPEREAAGSIGYWLRDWDGKEVFETGWSVLPAFQGQGVASEATRQLVEIARADGRRSELHAFPSVDNLASNGVCRKAGFTNAGPFDDEYPPGHPIRCNDWYLDLTAKSDSEDRDAST